MDEDEKADAAASDNTKTSKRDKLKGALARTKSRFKKHETDKHKESENILSHDVDEFLAAGRASTSSRNSTYDFHPSNHFPGHASAIPLSNEQSSRPSTSDSYTKPQQSPRRIVVPRIDVSNSQRWPAAQPIVAQDRQAGSEFLRPESHTRSRSASSLSKRKGRGRGLSVTFIEAPPVIIGEGGDDVLVPPVEISKARARARSFSPATKRQPGSEGRNDGQGPNFERDAAPRHHPPDILRPRGVRRVQTGMSTTKSASLLDKEFEMTLGLGHRATIPDSGHAPSQTPEIVAPRPMRPVRPPPPVSEVQEYPLVRESPGSEQQKQSKPEDMLRLHNDSDSSDGVEDVSPGGASSRGTSMEERHPSRWV